MRGDGRRRTRRCTRRAAETGCAAAAGDAARRTTASTSCAPTARGCARRRFAGRAANYLSYFAAATAASFGGRPAGRRRLADRSADSRPRRAVDGAARPGARFVFLCEDIFPEVATLLEDFQNATVNGALDRINRYLLRERRRDRRARRPHEAAAGRGEGRRPGARPRHPQLGRLRRDRRPAPKDNAFARAHGLADRFVLMHSGNVGLSQNLDVLDRGRRSAAVEGAAGRSRSSATARSASRSRRWRRRAA